MTIHIIAAVSDNNIIGNNGKIPWHIPNDLKRFKEKTIGHTIVMGRKTFNSLGNKPLPNRYNIVITKRGFSNVECVSDIDSLVERAKTSPRKYFIIGGYDVYKAFLPFCSTLSITNVHLRVQGDVEFPLYKGFNLISTSDHYNENISYTFKEYIR